MRLLNQLKSIIKIFESYGTICTIYMRVFKFSLWTKLFVLWNKLCFIQIIRSTGRNLFPLSNKLVLNTSYNLFNICNHGFNFKFDGSVQPKQWFSINYIYIRFTNSNVESLSVTKVTLKQSCKFIINWITNRIRELVKTNWLINPRLML